MGVMQWKWNFFDASCVPACTHAFAEKKPKAKIARCSSMSMFCPPATASRESIRGNQYQRTRLRANGGWGGG
jgi:hypothetical protein